MEDLKNTENLINMNHIMELADKYKNIESATLEDGFEVEFYPLFASDKIDNMFKDIGLFLSSDDKDGKPFVELVNSSEENFITFLYFMAIREFTHLGVDMKDTKPSSLFPYFEALVRTGYLTELIEDVFLPEEVSKLIKRMGTVSAIGAGISELQYEFGEALEQNKDKIARIQKYRDSNKKADEANG